METETKPKRKVPWGNVIAAFVCLSGGVRQLLLENFIFAFLVLTVGVANVLVVVRRLSQ